MTDLAGLIGLYPSFEQAAIGARDIPAELQDLDDAEIAELIDALGEDLVENPAWQDIFFGILKFWKGISVITARKAA